MQLSILDNSDKKVSDALIYIYVPSQGHMRRQGTKKNRERGTRVMTTMTLTPLMTMMRNLPHLSKGMLSSVDEVAKKLPSNNNTVFV